MNGFGDRPAGFGGLWNFMVIGMAAARSGSAGGQGARDGERGWPDAVSLNRFHKKVWYE